MWKWRAVLKSINETNTSNYRTQWHWHTICWLVQGRSLQPGPELFAAGFLTAVFAFFALGVGGWSGTSGLSSPTAVVFGVAEAFEIAEAAGRFIGVFRTVVSSSSSRSTMSSFSESSGPNSGTDVLASGPPPSTSEPVPCPSSSWSLSPPPVEGQYESLCKRPAEGKNEWERTMA